MKVAENRVAVHSSKTMFSARLPPVLNLVFYIKSLKFWRLGGLILRTFTDTIQVRGHCLAFGKDASHFASHPRLNNYWRNLGIYFRVVSKLLCYRNGANKYCKYFIMQVIPCYLASDSNRETFFAPLPTTFLKWRQHKETATWLIC